MIPKLITNESAVAETDFETKVKSMKASEIIMAMVDALTHPPIINVDMDTYGDVKWRTKTYLFGLIKGKTTKVCFGCAATNTICQISGKKFTEDNIQSTQNRAKFLGSDWSFLRGFEHAINQLRIRNVYEYNEFAAEYRFARIQTDSELRRNLVKLNNSYTNKDLEPYIKLANYNKAIELANE